MGAAGCLNEMVVNFDILWAKYRHLRGRSTPRAVEATHRVVPFSLTPWTKIRPWNVKIYNTLSTKRENLSVVFRSVHTQGPKDAL